ncbi:hypothetical protein SADUNF_Sadunf05G0151500 [Salix dunnii]|uniref:Uncharacterized protein n=1 Tax=Salix dunnii TaxID=1413687 RepID=A0A835K8J0_9ROSI|nr:hypothetical protein SADUNF_Sadunf05G0151500 [Salix dunnii]
MDALGSQELHSFKVAVYIITSKAWMVPLDIIPNELENQCNNKLENQCKFLATILANELEFQAQGKLYGITQMLLSLTPENTHFPSGNHPHDTRPRPTFS